MWGEEGGQAEEGQHTEVEDLEAQFAQQHQAMDHMRQMLAARDQQQAARIRQAQAYATRLSEIKSRSRASKRSVTGEAPDAEPRDGVDEKKVCEDPLTPDQEKEPEKQPGFGKKSDKFRHGNLSLLRKQMEENRIKFEQRGKEMTENKKGIEEMLMQLKRQVDERDQIIKGLQQKSDNIAQQDSSFDAADSVPQQMEPVLSSQESQQLQEMLADKDATIMQLNTRVQDLEASVFELQENLREKDSVIEARTKAIALLSEDLSKRSKTTLDTLDETRQQMRLMQQNFVALEARMKEEKDRLNLEIEAKDKRLAESQESIAVLEAARFDLSTRNAALQEKVVRLQELSGDLRSQQEVASRRAEELASALDEANKQAIRTKAQYGNKVKALRKQLDDLNKVTDVNEEISKLQNRIAELEEEKGNLQLHLVDFDELKVSETSLKQRLEELEERARQSSQDLDSHVHVISLLEAEKLDLLQSEQVQKQHISSLVAENADLKNNLSAVENEKVMLEMKAVELEEQLDVLSKERAELRAEMTSILQQQSLAVQGREDRFEVMELAKVPDAENIETVELDDRVGKNEKDSSNLEVVLRSLETELSEARMAVEEQKEVISDLNMKLDSKEEELELQQEMISKLEQMTAVDNRAEEENGDRITDILKDVKDMAADLDEWKTRCSEVEDRLRALEVEKTSLETRLEELRNENKTLSTMLQDQKNTSDQLMDKLKEQTDGISIRDANILKLQNMIEENGHVLKERELALQEVHCVLNEVQENFKNRYSELEARFQQKQAELDLQKSSTLELDSILASKDNELHYFKTEIDKRQHQLDRLESEHLLLKENLELSFNDKLQELSNQINQMSIKNQQLMQNINGMKLDILEKDKYIEKLELGIKNSEEVEKQLEITFETLNKTSEDLDKVKQELNVKCLECLELNEKLKETEEKNKEKTDKMKRLTANLKAKALALRGAEDKIKQLEITIETKESELSELNTKLADFAEKAGRATELEAVLKDKEEEQFQLKRKCEELTVILSSKEAELSVLANETTELKQLVEKLSSEKVRGEEYFTLEQNVVLLKTELDNREREIELLRAEQVELLRKCSEAEYKNNELITKISELECSNTKLEVNKSHDNERMAELEDEMAAKDFDYVEAIGKVEGLQDVIFEQRQEFLQRNRASSATQREMDVIGRDMKILELEEQISSIQERYQQTWAASEAKLQEREAVVESLELELSKSQERVRSLENTVSEMGDRQSMLELSVVALERQLEEAGRRLQEEEERRQLTEMELERLNGVETTSRQKLQEALEKKAELDNTLKEMMSERGELLKRISNLETTSREMSSEVERLSEFESAFNEESMRVQALMLQLRQQVVELESKNQDLEESRQYCESLESDLRTCREQLEELEAGRRTLISKEEKLLSKLKQAEENLTSASDEWEGKLNDQNDQIMQLQKEKEKLNDSLDKKQLNAHEVNENNDVFETQISELSAQLSRLKEVIVQKEEEVKTYQTRMLQLQFGGQSQHLTGDKEHSLLNKISQLEAANAELYERISQYEQNVSDLKEQLSSARMDIEEAYSKLNYHTEETRQFMEKTNALQEELNAKDIDLQELSGRYQDIVNSSNSLSVHAECESKLAALQHEKDELLRQFLCEKATSEVQNIITLAEERVRNVTSPEDLNTHQKEIVDENVEEKFVDTVAAVNSARPSVFFEERTCVFEPLESMQGSTVAPAALDDLLMYSTRIQELEDQLVQLQRELSIIEEERDAAIARAKELDHKLKETEKFEPIINQPVPVVEEMCVQKTAYLTYQPDEQSSAVDQDVKDGGLLPQELHNITFFQEQSGLPFIVEAEPVQMEEESWGWGTDEARLEEEHMRQKQQALAPAVEANERLLSLEMQLQALTVEKAALEEEAKATQARCEKLLHKLKDFKIKNDGLMKENLELSKRNVSASSFGDLDSAIEEEFKIRIDSLEKTIKDLTAELDTARLEREGLLKQIDVLTSANSKILEVKEKQDMDLDFCQKRYKELSNSKEAMEWVVEELTAENKLLASKIEDLESEICRLKAEKTVTETQEESLQERVKLEIQELQEQLTALAADNEHLQSLLEEQKTMRMKAEASLSKAESESKIEVSLETTGSAIDELRFEKERMTREIDNLSQELASVQSAYRAQMANLEASDSGSMENSLERKTCDRCNNLQKQYDAVIDALGKDMTEIKRQHTELANQLERTRHNLTLISQTCENMSMKWLRDNVSIEEETIALLQLRDTVRVVLQELNENGAANASEGLTLTGIESQEHIVAKLREGLQKKASDVESLTELIASKDEEIKQLHSSITLKDEKVSQLEEHVRYWNARVGGADDRSVDDQLEQLLMAREEELGRLRREVDNLRHEVTAAEERMLVKDEDIQSLRVQLTEKSQKLDAREQDVHELQQQLTDKDRNERELRWQLEERERVERELRQLLEEKERVEHELRQQLEERERYERELQQLQEEVTALRERPSSPVDPESSEQSELDLALYMLHQRDVRCDELTLELMQLLEERDTLQLRLSNALRANEELRNKVKSVTVSADLTSESPDAVVSRVSQEQVIGEPVVEENREDLQALDTKLSQLRSVGYRRDVTFQDEQEHRHSTQMKLLQRRGSGIVMDANYTLSRDVQPPSTVLLNWLRGRSTPRVMHV